MLRMIQVCLCLMIGFGPVTAFATEPDAIVEKTPEIEELDDDENWERWDGVALQLLVGPVVGVSTGAVFAVSGAIVGFLITDDPWAPLAYGAVAGVAGVAVGTIAGIHMTGELMGGDGSGWATIGGTLVGGAVGGLGFAALSSMDAEVAGGVVFGASVMAGGILGYHLSASSVVSSVSFAPTNGGGALMVQGRF